MYYHKYIYNKRVRPKPPPPNRAGGIKAQVYMYMVCLYYGTFICISYQKYVEVHVPWGRKVDTGIWWLKRRGTVSEGVGTGEW